jgi:diaminopimelate decarboxylase
MWADDIETPAYVYDLAEVRRCHGWLREALPPGATLYYSVKANPHPGVLATLHRAGTRAEVCSPGELTAALDAGYQSAEVLYTGPGKRATDLASAIKQGVRSFSVDSPRGLDDLSAAADALDTDVVALLRINDDRMVAGQRITMTGVASQFGADLAWVETRPDAFADRPRMRVTGVHLYMGSHIAAEDDLYAGFEGAVDTARRVRELLRTDFTELDLGGGFAAPFARGGDVARYPALADRLATLFDARWPGWRDRRPEVSFESGRYLTATCGRLLVRVLDVKRSHGKQVVVLESGINHLGGLSGLRRLPAIVPDLLPGNGTAAVDRIGPAGEPRSAWSDVLVTGPLCTPLDTWSRVSTMDACAPGDLLAVPNVGAYGLYASLVAFLGHPLPVEVTVDGDRVEASRLRLSREPSPPKAKE